MQDTPPPFDLLASMPAGLFFLVQVNRYSSMHGGRGPLFNGSHDQSAWPADASVWRAAGKVNLPVVLFVIDADREDGHSARLDRQPPPAPASGGRPPSRCRPTATCRRRR